MTETPDGSSRLILVSMTPGRARWEVRGMRGRPDFAARLQHILSSRAPIQSASANAVSGRVLVYYDDEFSYAAVCVLVEEAVGELFLGSAASEPVARNSADDNSGSIHEFASALIKLRQEIVGWLTARLKRVLSITDSDFDLLAGLIKPHSVQFGRALIGSLAANLLGVLRVIPIGLAMNALAHGYCFAGLGTVGTVALMTALAVGGTVLRGWLRQRSQIVWNSASRDFQHDLRLTAWQRVQRLETAFFDDNRRGTALSIMGEDINQCERGLDATYALIDLGFNTLLFSAAILAFSLTLGASSLLPIPVLVMLSLLRHPKVQEHFTRVGAEGTKLVTTLVDSLGGLTTVRSFTGEQLERDRIERTSNAYRATSQQSLGSAVALPLLLETTILVGQISIYLINSRLFAMGYTIGEFSIVNTASGHLLFPFTMLGPLIENIEKGLAAFRRVRSFLDEGPFEDQDGEKLSLRAVRGEVRYRDVRFSYPSGSPVFDGLSLSFEARSWTGVVGLTGSGKSTLVKLLLRFYRQQGGEIQLDGRNIASIRITDLRRAIALVSQDIYLFQRSVFENIAIGRPGASRKEVVAAAKAAQAHDFVSRLPQGYDTILGERGHVLSGGERQRVAIARALLKDAPILIFDEAMSSLDSNTEMDVQAALRPMFVDRTVIAIAHRLSTVRHADHIFVLERGQVVDKGTHSALVQRPGLYLSLWNSQLGLDESAR
jgi:ATP-binding cassette subfamily B protein